MYLLDTHVLLWLASDQSEISQVVLNTIKDNAGNLFVSSITAFEIAIKSLNKKIELPLGPEEWIHEALKFHQIEEIPINSKIAIQSVLLPKIHNDPCDRIIIATALLNRMPVLTKDKIISRYPGIEVIW
jgi:PIN domain nuclease of toxin-antitoxin system